MLPPSGPVMLPAIPQHVVANAAGRCFTRGSLVFFQRAEQKLSKKPRRGEQRGKQSKSRKGTISKFAIHHNPLPTTRVEIGSSAAAADVHQQLWHGVWICAWLWFNRCNSLPYQLQFWRRAPSTVATVVWLLIRKCHSMFLYKHTKCLGLKTHFVFFLPGTEWSHWERSISNHSENTHWLC